MATPPIEISVDPAAINRYIAEQILDSALGERLRDAVKEALDGLGRYGNDPLKRAVEAEVNRVVLELVRTEHADRIREAVRAALNDEQLDILVNTFVVGLTVGRT